MEPYRKWTAAKILELGEYSMIVNLKIPDMLEFRIMSRKEYWATEVIALENECIAYFNERIDNAFEKGGIYSIYISNVGNAHWTIFDIALEVTIPKGIYL